MPQNTQTIYQAAFSGMSQAAAPIRQDVYSDASQVPRVGGSVTIQGTQPNKNSEDLRSPYLLRSNA